MLKGKSVQELATELRRQETTKRDFVADSRKAQVAVSPKGNLEFNLEGIDGGFGINGTAHEQVAARLKIDKRYYDRMKAEAPTLLAQNINYWFQNTPATRMFRTLDGGWRGFLSNRFRPLDNFDLGEAVLPILLQEKAADIQSAELTERRMYIQAFHPRMEGEVQVGDVVRAGIIIRNSEIGYSRLSVARMIERLSCRNGAIFSQELNRFHVGQAMGEDGEDAEVLFSNQTKRLNDAALWAMVQDVVRASFDEKIFQQDLQTLRVAAGEKITADPVAVVERVQRRFGLNETERGSVLTNLIEGGDLSKWGLANAITALGNVGDNYDRAVDMEQLGGTVIELPKEDWNLIVGNN